MQPNIAITGDQARTLMLALATSESTRTVIELWTQLSAISQVQPSTPNEEPTQEGDE